MYNKRAKELVVAGTNVNCINYFGASPLIDTCKDNSGNETERYEFVRFLIEHGCDTTKTDIYGWTALLYAQKNGYNLIAATLERIERRMSNIENRDGSFCIVSYLCFNMKEYCE